MRPSYILPTGSFIATDAQGREYKFEVLDEYWQEGERLPPLKQYHRERQFRCFISRPWRSATCEAFLVGKGVLDIQFGEEDIRVNTDDPLANTYDGWQADEKR